MFTSDSYLDVNAFMGRGEDHVFVEELGERFH